MMKSINWYFCEKNHFESNHFYFSTYFFCRVPGASRYYSDVQAIPYRAANYLIEDQQYVDYKRPVQEKSTCSDHVLQPGLSSLPETDGRHAGQDTGLQQSADHFGNLPFDGRTGFVWAQIQACQLPKHSIGKGYKIFYTTFLQSQKSPLPRFV